MVDTNQPIVPPLSFPRFRLSQIPGNCVREDREEIDRRERMDRANETCTAITPHLFLGGSAAAQNHAQLEANKIHLVINLAGNVCFPPLPPLVRRITMFLMDSPEQELFSTLRFLIPIIDTCVQAGQNVFVHCQKGISRSSAVVIGYLMWKRRQNFKDVFAHVRDLRPACAPNAGFIAQLSQWRKIMDGLDVSNTCYHLALHHPAYNQIILGHQLKYDFSAADLDSRGVFILSFPKRGVTYIWIGQRAHAYTGYSDKVAEAKKLVEWLASNEHAPDQMHVITQSNEPSDFWDILESRGQDNQLYHRPTPTLSENPTYNFFFPSSSQVGDSTTIDTESQVHVRDEVITGDSVSKSLSTSTPTKPKNLSFIEIGPLAEITPEFSLDGFVDKVVRDRPSFYPSEYIASRSPVQPSLVTDDSNAHPTLGHSPTGPEAYKGVEEGSSRSTGIIPNIYSRDGLFSQNGTAFNLRHPQLHIESVEPRNRVSGIRRPLHYSDDEDEDEDENEDEESIGDGRDVDENEDDGTSGECDEAAVSQETETTKIHVSKIEKSDVFISSLPKIPRDNTNNGRLSSTPSPRTGRKQDETSIVDSSQSCSSSDDRTPRQVEEIDLEMHKLEQGYALPTSRHILPFNQLRFAMSVSPTLSADGATTKRGKRASIGSSGMRLSPYTSERSGTPMESQTNSNSATPEPGSGVEMYQYASWEKIDMFDSQDLSDDDIFLLAPSDVTPGSTIWVWIGMDADIRSAGADSCAFAQTAASQLLKHRLIGDVNVDIQVVHSGQEPEDFWDLFING